MSKLSYDFCKLTGVAAFITPYVQSFQMEEGAMAWFAVAFVVFMTIGVVMGHMSEKYKKIEQQKEQESAASHLPMPRRYKKRK